MAQIISKYSAQTEERYNAIYNTDPLFHEVYFDVKKASKKSTYGLPSL